MQVLARVQWAQSALRCLQRYARPAPLG